jgi:hypothetical protein
LKLSFKKYNNFPFVIGTSTGSTACTAHAITCMYLPVEECAENANHCE